MRSVTRFALFVGWTVVAGGAAFAQSPLELTVEDAVARGVAEAPRIAEARAREAAADAAVASRTALGRPTVTASSSYLRTNHVDEFGVAQPNGSLRVIFPDVPNNYQTRAQVSLPLFTSGRIGDLVASAEADRRAADADRRTTTADVTLDIVNAYWTLVMARERTGVLERALERAGASVADARARVESGVLPPNDLLSSQAQRARQNVQLIQARNDTALAEAQLGRLVGAELGQAIVTRTPVDRPAPKAVELAVLSVATLVARASETRPERQALGERQAALRASAAAALAAVRPQVSAMAGVEPARPNQRFVPRTDEWNTGWDLGITGTWALWDGGRARAERASILAQSDALRYRTEEFDDVVAVEVRQRLLDLESTRAALMASGEAVDAAAEARRVVSERFMAGVATGTEVLDADVVWLESELDRTRLTASLRIAEARLLRTVGAD